MLAGIKLKNSYFAQRVSVDFWKNMIIFLNIISRIGNETCEYLIIIIIIIIIILIIIIIIISVFRGSALSLGVGFLGLCPFVLLV
jgi:hypothetical protein